MKSILQNTKECFITHDTSNLHKHHIFPGGNRNNSEKYGLWIWLRADWHNLAPYGVHQNAELDRIIKETAQMKWEETYGTREEFRKIFGKSWLPMDEGK